MLGRVVAEAQAMGQPVVTSGVGTPAGEFVVPPRMPEELRTGWVVNTGRCRAIWRAPWPWPLSLDAPPTRRWRRGPAQFAEYMFSPQSVAGGDPGGLYVAPGARPMNGLGSPAAGCHIHRFL